MSALASLPGQMFTMGKNILLGLLHGLENIGGQVLSYVSNLAGSIISKIGSVLGIGSPSRKTYQHGLWLAEGLANGWRDGLARFPAAAAALGRPVPGSGGPPVSGAQVVFQFPPAGTGLDQMFFTWLAAGIRTRGGDPRILTTKVSALT
jgi:hypothetical protein